MVFEPLHFIENSKNPSTTYTAVRRNPITSVPLQPHSRPNPQYILCTVICSIWQMRW